MQFPPVTIPPSLPDGTTAPQPQELDSRPGLRAVIAYGQKSAALPPGRSSHLGITVTNDDAFEHAVDGQVYVHDVLTRRTLGEMGTEWMVPTIDARIQHITTENLPGIVQKVVENQLDAKLKPLSDALGDLRSGVQQLQAGFQQLETTLKDLRRDVQGMRSGLQRLRQADLEQCLTEVQQTRTDIEDLQSDIQDLRGDVRDFHVTFTTFAVAFSR
ncbi:hypothetical protein FRB99_008619 [Tulasnella sp. 403]|nr:hypothetical protein FRB99_008619 [Tulasnella sp. 403]